MGKDSKKNEKRKSSTVEDDKPEKKVKVPKVDEEVEKKVELKLSKR